MRKKLGLIASMASLLGALFSYASIIHADALNNEEKIRQEITRFMTANHVPGVAVEMYVNGQPKSYYFGIANEQKKIPVSGKTIFELGSLTKLMTSLILAQEVDSAKLQLNDSVKKFLPQLTDNFVKVSLRDLATHTAGLEFNLPKDVKTASELQVYLSKLNLKYDPEERWQYSNISVGLLGQALEKATSRDINQLYRKKILAPLGMQAIGTTVPKNLQRFYAQGHDNNDQPIITDKSGLLAAAWSMKASANDMQRFLRAAIGLPGTPESILYPIRMTETAYVELPNDLQGLGWRVTAIDQDKVNDLLDHPAATMGVQAVKEIYTKPMFDGDALIDKTGGTDGFRAYIALIPNKKSGIVILANRGIPNNDIVSTGRKILFAVSNIHAVPKMEEGHNSPSSS